MATDTLFPDLFGNEPEANTDDTRISFAEVSSAIYSLTQVAAACALTGDLVMGRAFVRATNELVEACMIRWPTVPINSVDQMVHAAAIDIRNKESQQTENTPMTTIIRVTVGAGEKRAVQVNDSPEYILIGPDESREFTVGDESTLTVSVHPGNRFEGTAEEIEEAKAEAADETADNPNADNPNISD